MSQLGSLPPGKTQDSAFLSARSLKELDAEHQGGLVPDINVAEHFEDTPDVDDLLAITAVRQAPPTHPHTHTRPQPRMCTPCPPY